MLTQMSAKSSPMFPICNLGLLMKYTNFNLKETTLVISKSCNWSPLMKFTKCYPTKLWRFGEIVTIKMLPSENVHALKYNLINCFIIWESNLMFQQHKQTFLNKLANLMCHHLKQIYLFKLINLRCNDQLRIKQA